MYNFRYLCTQGKKPKIQPLHKPGGENDNLQKMAAKLYAFQRSSAWWIYIHRKEGSGTLRILWSNHWAVGGRGCTKHRASKEFSFLPICVYAEGHRVRIRYEHISFCRKHSDLIQIYLFDMANLSLFSEPPTLLILKNG